jgi:hypothetical protein
MLYTNVLEKIETYFIFNNIFFFSKIVPFMKQCRKYSTVGEVTDDSMAHAHIMLNT